MVFNGPQPVFHPQVSVSTAVAFENPFGNHVVFFNRICPTTVVFLFNLGYPTPMCNWDPGAI